MHSPITGPTTLGRYTSNTRDSVVGKERIQSERLVDSVVIEEKEIRQDTESIRYVEVEPRTLPEKKIIKVPKTVPKYEVEYIEKIVEIPQVQVVMRDVEVPEYREVIKKVPVKQVIDVEKEVVKYIPRKEIRTIEKKVEVRGETIEIPKTYIVENKIPVASYLDKDVDTVVAQTIQPVVIEGATGALQVTLKEYEPELVPIEVYIPCPIQRTFQSLSRKDAHFRVAVPGAQYNSLVRELNVGLSAEATTGLLKVVYGEQVVTGRMGTSVVHPTASVVHPAGTSLVHLGGNSLTSHEVFAL